MTRRLIREVIKAPTRIVKGEVKGGFLSLSLLLPLVCVAQLPTMSSIEPTLTVCGPSRTVQLTIINPGGSPLISPQLQISLPLGVQYVNGSFVSNPPGATQAGPLIFNLPTIPAGQILICTFSIQATCEALQLLSDPNAQIVNSYQLTWQGGATSYTSTPYTLLEPALQYATITNQIYNAPGVGTTFTRTFTVTNTGNGALNRFTHRESWGNCLEVVNVSGGSIVSQNPTNLLIEFTSVHFPGGDQFDPGESISFSVTYRVRCCTALSSSFTLQWGCQAQVCRTVNAVGGVTVPGGTPNLITSHQWLLERSCYGVGAGTGHRFRITLRNTGNGPAREIQVNISLPFFRAINSTSLIVSLAGGGAVPFQVVNPNPAQGCFPGAPFLHRFDIQIGSDLQPGQEIYIEGDYYLCHPSCQPGNFHTDLHPFRWEVNYKSSCGNSYAIPSQAARTRSYAQTPIEILVPPCLNSAQPNLVTIQVERGPGIFILNPDGFAVSGTPIAPDYAFEWEFTLSEPCAQIVGPIEWIGYDPTNPSIPLVWSASAVFPLPNGVRVRFSEATRPPNWQRASFTNSFIRLSILSQCPPPTGVLMNCTALGGGLEVNLTSAAFFTPSLSCNPFWCYSAPKEVRLFPCTDQASCPMPGIDFTEFSIKRISYGLPDNNQDGVPDAPPATLDMGRIHLHKGMVSDTLEAYYGGRVNAQPFPSYEGAWAHLIFEGSHNVTLSAVALHVRIRKASSNQVFSTVIQGAALTGLVSDFPNCQGGGCITSFVVDLRPTTLQPYLPGLPATYEPGDSLKVWLQVRVEQILNSIQVGAQVTPCLLVSQDANSPPNNSFSCGLFQSSFIFIGHFYDSYFGSSNSSAGCQGANVQLITRFRPKGLTCGGNVFPFEYRHWSIPQRITLSLPQGWSYELNSGRISYGRTSGGTCASSTQPINPLNPAATVLDFPIAPLFLSQGGPLREADDEYNLILSCRLIPSCLAAARDTIRAIVEHGGRFTHEGRPWTFLELNPPVTLLINPVTNSVTADRNIIEWLIEIRNPTNNIPAPNVFLYLTSQSGQIVVQQVAQQGGGVIPLTVDHYRLGTLLPGEVRRYFVRATLSACVHDTLWAQVGWDCQSYPASAAAYPCTPLRVPLTYQLEFPVPIVTTTSVTPNPHNLCSPITIELQITNAGTAFMYNSSLLLQLPPYISYIPGTAQLQHPNGTGWVAFPDPVVTPTGLQWTLSTLVPSLQDGWPYQGAAATLLLRYQVQSSCGYISGQVIRHLLTATNVCGENLIRIENAPPLLLNLPPNLLPYTTTITASNAQVGTCATQIPLCMSISLQGPASTGNQDTIRLLLPPGWSYVPGTTQGNQNFGNVEPTVFQHNGQTYLSWPIPPNLPPNSTISFCFSVNPASSPAGTYTLFFQTLAPTTLTCGPNPCPTFVPTGQSTSQVTLIDLLYQTSITPVRCAGQAQGSISLSFNAPPPPGTTWQWSGPNGFTAGAVAQLHNLTAGTYTLTFSLPLCPPISTSLLLPEPPELNISASIEEEIRCHGRQDGEIVISATGGTPPYQYSLNGGPWQNSPFFSGLSAGTYTLQVQDANGCTATYTLSLPQPPPLTLNVTPIPPTCHGSSDGTLILSANGGIPPYQYSLNFGPWQHNPSFTGLSAGTYRIRVRDANGCVRIFTFNLSQPPPIVLNAPTVTNVNCNGGIDGSITVNASGGTPPYQYNLNGGPFQAAATFSGLSAGSYTITVQDANGCQASVTAVVTEPTAMVASVSGVVNVSCNGGNDGSVSVSASGGTPGYQYSLNGGPWVGGPGGTYTFTGLSAGTHTITVQDANGCQASTTVTVSEPPVLTFGVTTSNALCAGTATGSIAFSASGGTPPYAYSIDGGASYGSTSTWNVGAGTYVLYVRDANGCVAGPQTVTISEPAPLALQAVVTDAACRESSGGSALVSASGGTPPYTYTWSGAGLSGSVGGPSLGNVAPGSYTVVVVDANGCQDSLVVNVGYRSYVDVGIRPDSIAGCVPLGVRWEGVVSGAGPFVSYEWDLGDGNSANTPVVDWVYTVEGRYVVRLVVRNADGCSDTAYAVAEAYFRPIPQYVAEPNIQEDLVVGTIITLTSTTQGATSTQWFIPGYGSHSGSVWQVRFVEAGEYCFTLLVERNGCADSVRECIRMKDPYVYLPNAFTPNGDGVNDVFEVKVWGLKEARMRIWDRWGVLVFDNGGDMTKFWDGTYQGKPVPEDAYTYVIEGKVPPNDKGYRRAGTVTVVR